MTLTPEELRDFAELLKEDWLTVDQTEKLVAYLRACADAEPVALQGGLSNAQLVEAWRKKLPKVEASDRDLTAFALGVEVGCALRPDETEALRAEIVKLKAEAESDDITIDRLSARVAELEAQVAAKQAEIDRAAPLVKQIEAKVDALMLERCSDEMTPEQLTAWVTHQQAIRARGAGEKAP